MTRTKIYSKTPLDEMLSIYATYGGNDPDNEGSKTAKPYLRLVDDSKIRQKRQHPQAVRLKRWISVACRKNSPPTE